jgi:hypothetical protein
MVDGYTRELRGLSLGELSCHVKAGLIRLSHPGRMNLELRVSVRFRSDEPWFALPSIYTDPLATRLHT